MNYYQDIIFTIQDLTLYRSNRIDNFEIKLIRNIIDCDEPDYGDIRCRV